MASENVDMEDASPIPPEDKGEDPSTELERIANFARCDVFVQRLYHVCCMAEAAQKNGFSAAAPVLVPLCSDLSVDDEPEIRQALAEQLPQLAKVFSLEGLEASNRDISSLIQINHTLLTDEFEEVQMTSEQSFTELAQIVKPLGGSIHNDMLDIVIRLAGDAEESHRVCAANLLAGLSESTEREPFEEKAVQKIQSLSSDSEFRVRKAVALGLPRCFKAFSEHVELLERELLPVFLTLSKDSVWAVRMACAEGLVRIAEVVSPQARVDHLAATIEGLARDSSNWVRDSALQMLGPFLALLHGSPVLSERLVTLFSSMAEPSPTGDNRLQLYCAYNFPAVVQSLGPHRWEELEAAYGSLLGANEAAVRRSLGYSLHELAQALGDELSEIYLVKAYNTFMSDVDEVRLGVATNLVQFLGSLPKPSRLSCVLLLEDIASFDDFKYTPTARESQIVLLGSNVEASTSEGQSKQRESPVEEVSGESLSGGFQSAQESFSSSANTGEVEQRNQPLEGRYVRVISAKRLWHLRKTLADQLVDISALLDFEDIHQTVVPLALQLCRDPVATVREEASKQVSIIIHSLLQSAAPDVELTAAVLSIFPDLRNFAISRRFRERQVFSLMCSELVKHLPTHIFVEQLLSALVLVSQDHVPNVRIKAAEALMEVSQTSEELKSHSAVQLALQRLAADEERDVALLVSAEWEAPGTSEAERIAPEEEKQVEFVARLGTPEIEQFENLDDRDNARQLEEIGDIIERLDDVQVAEDKALAIQLL